MKNTPKRQMMVWLGGPMRGLIDWTEHPPEKIVLEGLTKYSHHAGFYRRTFGDEYIDIFYWNISEFQKKALEQQVVQLRIRHGDPPAIAR